MNCFMSYNPNVAKEVKITTWIKEFDGASPVYPSFPNDGDVFIVFDTDEAKEPSVNKTYTSGEWADTSSGGGGSSDFSMAEVTLNIAHGTSVQTDYPYIDEEFNQVSVNDYENGTTDTNSFIIPLYTEGAYFRMDGIDGEPTIVGDAVYDNGYFIVTGDCTITVTGTPMT